MAIATSKALASIAQSVLRYRHTAAGITHSLIESTVRECIDLVKATELERLEATVKLMKLYPANPQT